MISSPLPVPAPTLPVPAPAAAQAAPPAAGDAAEASPGAFARLLDQARDGPADSGAAAQNGEAATDKTTRTRTPRPAPGRPAGPQADLSAETTPAQRDDGNGVGMTVGIESAADTGAPAPAASADTAALLASLAAFARPQPAPETPAGKTAHGGGDEPEGAARPRSAGRAPAALQPDAATPAAARATARWPTGDAATGERGAAAATTAETPAGADPAAQQAGRSFAAELQATLASPVLATPAAGVVQAAGTAAGAPGAQAQLAASPGSAAFAPELGATLATFVRDGVHHARLELNPADMGPVTVQIQLDGQTAQVHLAAQHADTRQALEQAMPTLAGSLREAGLTLSGGGVFEQPRQPQQQPDSGPGRGNESGGKADDPLAGQAIELPAAAPLRRRGVVDLVA